jgi:hypothetical protein
VTISFWFRANHPTGSLLGVTLRNLNSNPSYVAPFTVTNSGVWQFVSFTVPPPPNGGTWYIDNNSGIVITFCGYQTTGLSPVVNSWTAANYVGQAGGYNWFANAGNYIEFTGVQLERGTVATPFEFRPFAQELALCQRYFYHIMSPTVAVSGAATQFSIFGVGLNYTTTSGDIVIFYPVAMRTAIPTFSSSAANTFQVVVPSGSVVLTAISGGATDSNTPQTARVSFTVASGLLAGNAVWIRSNSLSGSSVAYIAFSCEL